MVRYLPHFIEEVLKRISAATYVATFADRVAFTETLQRHKEDFSSLLQHMANCYKALFTNKVSCAGTRVAITLLVNEFKSIQALHKNINAVAMLTGDALLRHFRKGMYHGGIGTLITILCTLDHTNEPQQWQNSSMGLFHLCYRAAVRFEEYSQ